MRWSGTLAGLLAVTAVVVCGTLAEGASPASAASHAATTTVVLSGPTDADPNQTCTWTATASGGTGPYTFNWDWSSARGDVTGTVGYSSDFTGHVAGSYTFIVTVTDANNVTDADTLQGSAGGSNC